MKSIADQGVCFLHRKKALGQINAMDYREALKERVRIVISV